MVNASMAAASPAAIPIQDLRDAEARATTPLNAANTNRTRSVAWDPIAGIIQRLTASAPTMPPTVLAAYTVPAVRPESSRRRAAAAQASGKLAPQKRVAGMIAQRQ